MCDGKILKRTAEDIELYPMFHYRNLLSKSYIILRKINFEIQKNVFLEFGGKSIEFSDRCLCTFQAKGEDFSFIISV
jgi:hypothetical protein